MVSSRKGQERLRAEFVLALGAWGSSRKWGCTFYWILLGSRTDFWWRIFFSKRGTEQGEGGAVMDKSVKVICVSQESMAFWYFCALHGDLNFCG